MTVQIALKGLAARSVLLKSIDKKRACFFRMPTRVEPRKRVFRPLNPCVGADSGRVFARFLFCSPDQ